MTNVATDRYQALGIPYPDPVTVCHGQCEGAGFVPIHKDEQDRQWRTLWLAAEEKSATDDGWHFVECPECHGTGKAMEK